MAEAVSLTDALLLEAYPLDVWIAARTDGAKGSGTENDPCDATPRQEVVVSISQLDAPEKPREAEATDAGHQCMHQTPCRDG